MDLCNLSLLVIGLKSVSAIGVKGAVICDETNGSKRNCIYKPFRKCRSRHLEHWKLTCRVTSNYVNFLTSSLDSSGILLPNGSFLAAESSSSNESATVGSNCSRECSDGFYLHQELGSCRPQCAIWELTSSTAQVVVAIISVCFAAIFIVVDLVVTALQWKR